jgi:hypothetical protein
MSENAVCVLQFPKIQLQILDYEKLHGHAKDVNYNQNSAKLLHKHVSS